MRWHPPPGQQRGLGLFACGPFSTVVQSSNGVNSEIGDGWGSSPRAPSRGLVRAEAGRWDRVCRTSPKATRGGITQVPSRRKH